MPRVPENVIQPSEIYGKVQVDNTKTFGERVRQRFRPTDTVKVHNITDQFVEWQWLDEQDETYTIEDGSNVKIVEREDPGIWRLGPGEFDILQGSCAYLMVEALYKQITIAKVGITLHPLDERQIKNFAFDDPVAQETIIDKIFQGKVTPNMMMDAASQSLGSFAPQIKEHLPKLANERIEYEQRTGEDATPAVSTVIPTAAPVAPAEPAPHQELADLGTEFSDDNGESQQNATTTGLPGNAPAASEEAPAASSIPATSKPVAAAKQPAKSAK